MKDITIIIAKKLFSKHIPFCLYRFPGEVEIHLALEDKFLPHKKGNAIWMSPFSEKSNAKNIYWSVVKNDYLNEQFYSKIAQFPTQTEDINFSLPEESTKADYLRKLNKLLNDIHSNKIRKAVLSRVLYEKKPKDFNIFNCFLDISKSYPATFAHLSFHPHSGIWMGATPELLLKKRNEEISIMALAGTQKRNATGNYEWREKEREEHFMVGEHIEEVFKKHGYILLSKGKPKTIETAHVAHLRTNYLFKEENETDLKTFLKALHPTPAVGGLPAKDGEQYVLKNDGYDRKYYSGFIGETNFNSQADLYVNLRCMQIGKEKIALFIGGGITADSVPEEEWNETVEKSKTMLEKIK